VNNRQQRINIRIGGRAYPLTVDRDDEERHRIAEKRVNETVVKYRELFHDKDWQDILAMAAFQIALDHTGLLKRADRSLFIEGLKDLNDDISDFLKENIEK
jgi:cell division protein ZapA